MSKCEACGGDGQIEYGAYRGDEAGPTRERRLCGGVITTNPTIADIAGIGVSAQSASAGFQRLAHSVSESGRRFTDLVVDSAKEIREEKRRREALEMARDIAAERLERLRQENERRQLEAESTAHVDEYYKKRKLGIIP